MASFVKDAWDILIRTGSTLKEKALEGHLIWRHTNLHESREFEDEDELETRKMGRKAELEQYLYIPDKIVLTPERYESGINNAHGIIWKRWLLRIDVHCANYFVVTSTGDVMTTLISQIPKVMLHIEDNWNFDSNVLDVSEI